ncbi:hypothetical protein GCM10009122_44360 [Fulvivirga kasyanovii]|uniref:hypothetical protein n=1 Tax=Fulvivirga kasyanovii TaxID=396812 RepID=UPI0031D97BFE
MKNLDLNEFDVQELGMPETLQIEGGGPNPYPGWYCDVMSFFDGLSRGASRGYTDTDCVI